MDYIPIFSVFANNLSCLSYFMNESSAEESGSILRTTNRFICCNFDIQDKNTYAGSFMYHLDEGPLVSIGYVVSITIY